MKKNKGTEKTQCFHGLRISKSTRYWKGGVDMEYIEPVVDVFDSKALEGIELNATSTCGVGTCNNGLCSTGICGMESV